MAVVHMLMLMLAFKAAAGGLGLTQMLLLLLLLLTLRMWIQTIVARTTLRPLQQALRHFRRFPVRLAGAPLPYPSHLTIAASLKHAPRVAVWKIQSSTSPW
jgi:hypothetical protein